MSFCLPVLLMLVLLIFPYYIDNVNTARFGAISARGHVTSLDVIFDTTCLYLFVSIVLFRSFKKGLLSIKVVSRFEFQKLGSLLPLVGV